MSNSTFFTHKKVSVLSLLGVVLITFLIYKPVLSFDFVNWDDDVHLLKNPAVLSLTAESFKEVWSQTVNRTYIPLTTLSFAVEYHFFQADPFIYHLNNLLLHLFVSSTVFYFCRLLKLSLFLSFVAAFLFAIHPLHVESVAWVTGRKDVLFCAFYMGSVCSYFVYIQRSKRLFYVFSLVLGLLSILAKPMALSLPLILILCDWYAGREKTAFLWKDKVPFFAFIIPIAWMTYIWHVRMPINDAGEAVLTWVWSLAFYIRKFFDPVDLFLFYRRPLPVSVTNPEYLFAVVILLLFIGLTFFFRKERTYIFGLLFFLLSIFFVIRFDNTVDINFVADHYIYLPSIGLSILTAFLVEKLRGAFKEARVRKLLTVAFLMPVIMLSLKTYQQTGMWRNSWVLWGYQLKYNPTVGTALVYHKLGEALVETEHFQKVLERNDQSEIEYVLGFQRQALAIKPDYANAYFVIGKVRYRTGELKKAEMLFNQAVQHNPSHFEAFYYLGGVYAGTGRPLKASEAFRRSVEINPDNKYHVQKVKDRIQQYKL